MARSRNEECEYGVLILWGEHAEHSDADELAVDY
jgi:hypothetical protein